MWQTRHVISATDTWSHPHVPHYPGPHYPGQDRFAGLQVHSAHYASPAPFESRRVLVVGGGNSGAQIHAELSETARSTWVTTEPPQFLPDDVDGRVLFDAASARFREAADGAPAPNLADIVMVPPVRRARDRGDLTAVRPFAGFTATGVVWRDGTESDVDAVVWCTGFRPSLDHLAPLGVVEADGRVAVEDQRSIRQPNLWLHGYGDWTGFASATLVGSARVARGLVRNIAASLGR